MGFDGLSMIEGSQGPDSRAEWLGRFRDLCGFEPTPVDHAASWEFGGTDCFCTACCFLTFRCPAGRPTGPAAEAALAELNAMSEEEIDELFAERRRCVWLGSVVTHKLRGCRIADGFRASRARG
jgi:hypothetical protein